VAVTRHVAPASRASALIVISFRAAIEPERYGIDLASACRSQGAGEILENILQPSDAVTEEAGEEGAEGPCSGVRSGAALFPMNLAGLGGSSWGFSAVLPWWASRSVGFTNRFLFGGLVEG